MWLDKRELGRRGGGEAAQPEQSRYKHALRGTITLCANLNK